MTDMERSHEHSPPTSQRLWFRVEEVEIRWLPCGEAAFLLWVLVALGCVMSTFQTLGGVINRILDFAFVGSSTPPMPTPPDRCTFLPICAHEPTVAQVSTIVPSST
jgi:hypothetical protein